MPTVFHHSDKTKKLMSKYCKLGVIGMKGKKHSKETRLKMRLSAISRGQKPQKMFGKENPQWKGEDAGYSSIHKWIVRHKGSPKKCQICGKEYDGIRMSWANIDHKYKRNLDDYIPLCGKCHWKYDMENGNRIFNHFKSIKYNATQSQ